MTILTAVAAIMFVVSIYGMLRISNGGPYVDAGPPMAMLLVACVIAFVLSLILFGGAVGFYFGART